MKLLLNLNDFVRCRIAIKRPWLCWTDMSLCASLPIPIRHWSDYVIWSCLFGPPTFITTNWNMWLSSVPSTTSVANGKCFKTCPKFQCSMCVPGFFFFLMTFHLFLYSYPGITAKSSGFTGRQRQLVWHVRHSFGQSAQQWWPDPGR